MSKKGLAIWEILVVGIRRRDGRMVSMCQNIRFNTFSILSCLLSDVFLPKNVLMGKTARLDTETPRHRRVWK